MLLLTLVALVFATQARAGEISGHARIVDGDTIEIGGQVIRLAGIDAPESGQRCTSKAGKPWACGIEATDTLRSLVAGRSVTCTGAEMDKYDRLIALCRSGDRALNQMMVSRGMAVAFLKYSRRFETQEREAQAQRAGMWAGAFERPRVVRARRWTTAAQTSPKGCPIKGNISERGRIYHTPYSRHYDRTRINTKRGERWFCSESEALQAGWRAPLG